MKFLSPRTHSIIGFIVGLVLLVAPNIFGFNNLDGAAVTVPRVIGLIILLSELSVKGGFSGFGFISMKLHIITDVVLGVILATSPWMFNFSDEKTNAWVTHLIVGLVVVAYTLVTRTNEEESTVTTHA